MAFKILRSKWETELPSLFWRTLTHLRWKRCKLRRFCMWKGGFGNTGVNGKNNTGEEKELECENERNEKKEEEDKNYAVKGKNSGKQRTEKSRKLIEGTSRLEVFLERVLER